MGQFASADMMEFCIIIAAAAIVIFLIIGLIKKALWMCVVAIVIAALVGITQPAQLEEAKDSIIHAFNTMIEPLSGNDYSDIVGEEYHESPNKSFGEIGKD